MIDVMIDVRNAKCQIVDRVASCAVRSEILSELRCVLRDPCVH